MENTTEIYESPNREKNERKFGIKSTPQCICCMKPISNFENSFTVHMNEAWKVVHPSINEVDCLEKSGANSQGCFDVGPECAKKMKGFTVKNQVK